MKARLPWKLQPLLREAQRIQELMQKQEYPEAQAALPALQAEARKHGLASAHLWWSLAIAHDQLGALEAALNCIEEALALDPLASPYHRSRTIITQHLREALLNEERREDDAEVPRLHALLVRTEAADVDCHLRLARYHLKTDGASKALELLSAVTRLHATCAEAWALQAEAARAAGENELAQRSDFEASALGHSPSPLPVLINPKATAHA